MPIGPSAPHGTDFGTVPCRCRSPIGAEVEQEQTFLCIAQSISQCLKKKKLKKKLNLLWQSMPIGR
jgi:hypothetical protein